MPLYTPINNAYTNLIVPHNSGDGVLWVADNTPFRSPTSARPIRVTAFRNTDRAYVILGISGVVGTSGLLIDRALETTNDITLNFGDPVQANITAGTISDIHQNFGIKPTWQYATGYYYFVSMNSSTTSAAMGVGTLRAQPTYLPDMTINSIGAEIVVTGDPGSVVRLGIYSDASGFPGALVYDAGTISATTVGTAEIPISVPITQGQYWFAAAVQNTVNQPTLRATANADFPLPAFTMPGANQTMACLTRASVTSSLPTNFSATSISATAPRIFFKTG